VWKTHWENEEKDAPSQASPTSPKLGQSPQEVVVPKKKKKGSKPSEHIFSVFPPFFVSSEA
jgi:hypothetical protein